MNLLKAYRSGVLVHAQPRETRQSYTEYPK